MENFENFEFEEKFNPWNIESLEDFHFYCCPQCEFRNLSKSEFIKHAVMEHPDSQDLIDKLEGKKHLNSVTEAIPDSDDDISIVDSQDVIGKLEGKKHLNSVTESIQDSDDDISIVEIVTKKKDEEAITPLIKPEAVTEVIEIPSDQQETATEDDPIDRNMISEDQKPADLQDSNEPNEPLVPRLSLKRLSDLCEPSSSQEQGIPAKIKKNDPIDLILIFDDEKPEDQHSLNEPLERSSEPPKKKQRRGEAIPTENNYLPASVKWDKPYCTCKVFYPQKFYVGCYVVEPDHIEKNVCHRCKPNLATERKLTAKDCKEIKKLVQQLLANRNSILFQQPVDPNVVPNYYKVIKRQMDLSTVQRKVNNGKYTRLSELIDDVMQIFENCRVFYQSDNTSINKSIRLSARNLEGFFSLALFQLQPSTIAEKVKT